MATSRRTLRLPLGIGHYSDLSISIAAVVVVAMMVIPLPTWVVDILLTANICLTLTVLLVTMYVRHALEFSVFPSMLLVATLFRLALNISATRLVLLHADAGAVIHAFGSVVVGGNYVVGLVVFFILVVIQFVVITNGAGRVAEVAARFTLDAMPGKQMAIDADLNAGLIEEGEARRRRRAIAQEADFYGAMDGASKFVRGDAINSADAGVRAVVIDTGADTDPYKLLISSETSGTDGAMTIDVDLTGGTAPTFTDVQAAQDASLTFGSGAGAVTVTRGSNTISDVIPGVTLTLLDTQTASPVSVAVTRDTSAIREKIDEFVTAYNDLVGFINEQSDYDVDTGATGTLFGEYRLSSLHNQLASIISNPVEGIASGWSLLSQIGIRLGMDGKLTVDSSDLDTALANDPEGVRLLFARYGTAANSAVTYVSATADTRPSGPDSYAIEVTQVATQSRVTAGVSQTEVLAGDETLTINGVEITLTAGMAQAQGIGGINAHSDETGVTASATDASGQGSGNYLTLTRVAYGSGAGVTVVSTVSNGGGSPVQNTTGIGLTEVSDDSPTGEAGNGTGESGVDIAGTINGEAAEGSGQVLVSTAGDSEGLRVLVRATSIGSYGKVVYTAGAAGRLDALLAFVTEDANGAVHAAQDVIEDRIHDIDDEIDHLEDSIAAEQERIRRSFQAMEEALARLQTQSSYLEQYLAQIRANSATG